ncbi:hypothetical protein BDR26DRAFT_1004425 [Obelidium mucronatum]|nr:hypothetical protein BDR26DRAFT_1004425 [Obelidium mucronatum]
MEELLRSLATNHAVLDVLTSASVADEVELCRLQSSRSIIKEIKVEAELAASKAHNEWIKLKQESNRAISDFVQIDTLCQVARDRILAKRDVISNLQADSNLLKKRVYEETGLVVVVPTPQQQQPIQPPCSSSFLAKNEPIPKYKLEFCPNADKRTRDTNSHYKFQVAAHISSTPTASAATSATLPSISSGDQILHRKLQQLDYQEQCANSVPGTFCRGPELDPTMKMFHNPSSSRIKNTHTFEGPNERSVVLYGRDLDSKNSLTRTTRQYHNKVPVTEKKSGYSRGGRAVDAVVWMKRGGH